MEKTKIKSGSNMASNPKRKFNLEKAASDIELSRLEEIINKPENKYDASLRDSQPQTDGNEGSFNNTNTADIVQKSLAVVSGGSMMEFLNQPLDNSCNCRCYQTQQQLTALQQEIQNVQQLVQWLEGKLYSSNLELNSLRGTPPQQNQTSANNNTMEDRSDERTQPRQNDNSGEEDASTFNNFTKKQLRAFIAREKTFSKASKVLFRILFKPEETGGRKGLVPNKNTLAKPALENRERFTVLYGLTATDGGGAAETMNNSPCTGFLGSSMAYC